MYEPRWVHPSTVGEAVAALAGSDGGVRPVAGATDLAVRIRADRIGPNVLVDLTGVKELATISCSGDELTIGALASHAAVACHPVIRERAGVLAQACRSVGSPQIRARGTVGGNLANASPAADATVALAALDAVACACSTSGERKIPVVDLFDAPGRTVLASDELLTHVTVALPRHGATGFYKKLGQRKALAIAIVSSAVTFDAAAGSVRIALGSVAPTVVRATAAEEFFAGEWERVEDRRRLIEAVAEMAVHASCPIDDVRASGEYRAILVGELTRTALEELCFGE